MPLCRITISRYNPNKASFTQSLYKNQHKGNKIILKPINQQYKDDWTVRFIFLQLVKLRHYALNSIQLTMPESEEDDTTASLILQTKIDL